MATERKAIRINPRSELGRELKHASEAGEPVLVETGAEVFELLVHPAAPGQTPVKTAPSAEQVARSIAGIRKASGGWKDLVDADELTAFAD